MDEMRKFLIHIFKKKTQGQWAKGVCKPYTWNLQLSKMKEIKKVLRVCTEKQLRI